MRFNFNSSKATGIALVVAGLALFAARSLGFGVTLMTLSWPLFIVLPGVGLLAFASIDRDVSKALAPIGMMVTLTGCLLAYQDWANHYQSWAYMWVLVGPFALGAGWIAHSLMHDDNRMMVDGRKLLFASIVILLVLAAVFELIFNISGYGLSVNLPSGMLLPVVLIVIGGAILVRQIMPRASHLQQNHGDHASEDTSNDV